VPGNPAAPNWLLRRQTTANGGPAVVVVAGSDAAL
jgi:hypothetical protein